MSLYYTVKTWLDRVAGNKNKRSMVDVDTSETINYLVERAEGKIYESELTFTAANMNNIEGRINSAFSSLETLLNPTTLFNTFYPVGIIYLSYNNVNPGSPVAQGGLGGGTWTRLSGGLLIPSSNLPADMRNNLQWEGQNSREVNPAGTVSLTATGGYTNAASAGLPDHSHTVSDTRAYEHNYSSWKFKNVESDYAAWRKLKYTDSVTGSAGTSNSSHKHKFTGSGSFTSGGKITIDTTQQSLTISAWVRTA